MRTRDTVFSVVVSLALLLFLPQSEFDKMNMNWVGGLVIVLPATFIAGLLSSWIYYRHHNFESIDPFYIRAWWAVIGGLAGLPVCLLFRPIAADFAFIIFTFGAGPVIAFHVYRRVAIPRRLKLRSE